MKKSNFITLVLSTIGILLLSIAMCMCLLPQWNVFNQGVILGLIGVLMLCSTYFIYCRMEDKVAVVINRKVIGTMLVTVIAIGLFGIGMSLTMVFNHLVIGIITGCLGIILLLFLIPLCKGIKE